MSILGSIFAMGLTLVAMWTQPACAQTGGRSEIFAGSELENYIRLLQIDGKAALYPWSIRSFSPSEIDRLLETDQDHPWRGHYDLGAAASNSGLHFDLVRPRLTTYYNTTFPWGANDGPVWQGKGATIALQAGFSARYGPVSLTMAPMVFGAQNADFELQDNGQPGDLRFADGRFSTNIDRPQRFGDGVYSKFDLGQSTLRVDLPIVTFGASTANQAWGPGNNHPILLGNNAAGFPHVFLGSSAPLDLGFARIHGRLVWGSLSQSDFSTVPDEDRRFMSGILGVISPKWVEGLELGGARFFHQPWPAGGLSFADFKKPLESILKSGLPDDPNDPANPSNNRADNQVVSFFFRWAFPLSGFEVYGEYGREDHSWNFRDFLLEPDHSGGYMLGFTKTFPAPKRGTWALRAEVLDLRVSQLIRVRKEGPFYVHSGRLAQGHTERGQILGSAAGLGGGAASLVLDRYHRGGRWTAFWSRELRQDIGNFWQTGMRQEDGFDVQHAVGGEALFFRNQFDVTAGLTAVYNLNRNFGSDRFNLGAHIAVRANLGSFAGGPSSRPSLQPRRDSVATKVTAHWLGGALRQTKFSRTTQPSGYLADRIRLAELIGDASPNGLLLRSASSVVRAAPSHGSLLVEPIAPEIEFVSNSSLPYSLNRGSLWAGRGRSVRMAGGVRIQLGKMFLNLAPELTHSQNRDFDLPDPRITPLADQLGNAFADPWYVRPNSIDRPIRFGNAAFTEINPGQSTLGLDAGAITVGLSNENEWWGPGIRNAIVLSDNAPGFAHFFARTSHPLETPIGRIEGRWLVGALRESEYFDSVTANNTRSFSALAATWTPNGIEGLSLGITRAVYRPVDGIGAVPGHLFDAIFTYPGRPNDRPPGDSTQTPGPDQIFSLFGRWVFPKSGFEVYGEWARTELPSSLRDLLTAPDHTQGYTLGLQWARPLRSGRDAFRLQAEHTYLERSTTFRDRPVGTYYTSRAVAQGYTNQGRVLGAAIGPGSSSHWLALDYFGRDWEVGLFGERVRWNNDALGDRPIVTGFALLWCKHDVTVRGGLRGAYSFRFGRVAASLSRGKRMNVFFQHFTVCGRDENPINIIDTVNTTLELKYSLHP